MYGDEASSSVQWTSETGGSLSATQITNTDYTDFRTESVFSAVRSAADDKISCSFRYIADDQRVGASADVKYIAGECSFVTTHVLSSLWDQI